MSGRNKMGFVSFRFQRINKREYGNNTQTNRVTQRMRVNAFPFLSRLTLLFLMWCQVRPKVEVICAELAFHIKRNIRNERNSVLLKTLCKRSATRRKPSRCELVKKTKIMNWRSRLLCRLSSATTCGSRPHASQRSAVVTGGGCSVRRGAGSLLRLTVVGSPCTHCD